jgi:hypothetical protein
LTQRTLPHLGGTIGRRSEAQGSEQDCPAQHSQDALPQPPQDLQGGAQRGNAAQNSSHSTAHTVFLTFCTSQTTLQVLGTPQWGQHSCVWLPQATGSPRSAPAAG